VPPAGGRSKRPRGGHDAFPCPIYQKDTQFSYGIIVDGEHGGQWMLTVRDARWEIEAVHDMRNAQAVIRYRHPSDMVFTSYFRMDVGEITGDLDVIQHARRLCSRPI
jgi:hypothetical protein